MSRNGTSGLEISPTTINAAMRYIYDQMERCVIFDYVILGEAGKAIFEGRQIDAGEIEIGIKKASFTPNVISLFKEWGYKEDEKGTWTTSFEGVPIIFKIIKGKYEYLKNPDVRFYDVDEYHIPNPFDKYYKARYLVK